MCEHWVTDRAFGSVVPGDDTFLERFDRSAGYRPDRVVWMDQVHGTRLAYVDDAGERLAVAPETDGLWTDRPQVMLVVKTADCAPLLLWSEKEGIVAALHCGWKGFTGGLIESFGRLCRDRSLEASSFSAFLGPHLRIDNFEVRQDFVDQLPESKMAYLVRMGGGYRYDLTRGIIETLRSMGITNVEDCGEGTYSNPRYFSYRAWAALGEGNRPKEYSTFASLIALR